MKKQLFLILLAVLPLLVGPSFVALAQQSRIKVQGRVTDSKGEALPGAMVIVDGTQNGAMTDAEGRYSLSNVSPKATITASLMGYEDQTTRVDGRTTVDFSLKDDALATMP